MFSSRYATVLSGNVIYAFAQMGVLIILAREASITEVGTYALALAIAAPIQIGLGVRLRTARVVTHPARFGLGTYYRLAVIMAVLSIGLSAIVSAILLGIGYSSLVVTLVAVSKAVESLIDVSYGELQRKGHLPKIARSQLLRSALTLTGAGIAVALDYGAAGVASSSLVLWLIQFVAYDRRQARRSASELVEERYDDCGRADRARDLLKATWPLGLAAAITSLNGAAPRLIVYAIMGTQSVGVIALLGYPTTVMTLLANSLGQAELVKLRSAFEQRDVAARKRIRHRIAGVTLLIGGGATLTLLTWGEPLIRAFVGETYAEHTDVSIIMMTAATIGALATASYYDLTSTGSFSRQPLISLAVALVGLPTIWLMTDLLGLAGTALGMLIAFLFQWLVTRHVAGRRYRRAANPELETVASTSAGL